MDSALIGAIGLVAAAAVTAAVAYIGVRINRSIAVDTTAIDDRDKFTQKLISQLDRAEARIEELDKRIKDTERREISFLWLIGSIATELRLTHVSFETQILVLKQSEVHPDAIELLIRQTSAGLQRVLRKVEHEQRLIGESLFPGGIPDPESITDEDIAK